MVIDKVITKAGIIDRPKYEYNWATSKPTLIGTEPFYYKKVYIIEGVEFVLGSLKKGKIDTLMETSTGASALIKEEVGTFNDDSIIQILDKKLCKHDCTTLHDVVTYYQNNQSAYRIELWKIGLFLS